MDIPKLFRIVQTSTVNPLGGANLSSAHESLWKEIPCYTVFLFTATLDIFLLPPITVQSTLKGNKYIGWIW
jgi:hypothetical protein